jgi:hypothetical protein
MTTPTRIERSLPSILGDLAAGPTPDYIDDVLGQTAGKNQRPAWTFPERWIPMADIASRPTFMPRVSWRTIGVALVIIVLLIAGTVALIGSRQIRLPAPFGPAANGLIPYTLDGDIYLGDPVNGRSRLLVGSPERESGPTTSPDGTRVAFARDVAGTTLTDVFVIRTDGSDLHRITPEPIDLLHWGGWTPAGDRLALIHDLTGPVADCATTVCHVAKLDLVDAAGSGDIRTIATVDGMDFVQFRPPDGRELMYRAVVDHKWGLFAMDLDGSNVRAIAPPTVPSMMDLSFAGAAYSADGNRIFYQHGDEGGCCQLWVMNADGSDPHEFLPLGPAWDGQAVPSPDGTWIAYWHNANDGPAHGITVVRADGTGQPIETGPKLPSTAHWLWSPDSTRILMFPNDTETSSAWLLDPAGGPATKVPWTSNGDLDWQRLAPPG